MKQVRVFLEAIKFEHTVFALPFAYIGMLLANRGFPPIKTLLWITLAMVSARTYAMTLNRIVDLPFDRKNPRTWNRPLVTGALKLRVAWGALFISLLTFLISAYQLGPLPFKLSPVALFFLTFYHFTKRFTWLSHFFLGFTDGLAPLGAWLALRRSLFHREDLGGWLLTFIVTFWIAGFDIIYACLDIEVDRRDGLKSIPAVFGLRKALWISTLCHLIMLGGLVTLGLLLKLGWPFWIGSAICGGLLLYEHSLVKPEDLSKVNIAFFNVNSYISLVLFFSITLSVFLPK